MSPTGNCVILILVPAVVGCDQSVPIEGDRDVRRMFAECSICQRKFLHCLRSLGLEQPVYMYGVCPRRALRTCFSFTRTMVYTSTGYWVLHIDPLIDI